MSEPPTDSSPMAVAAQWAARIMTVAVEMVVPGLVGLWIDRLLGTKVVFALLGFGFGITMGVWHLVRMTQVAGPGKTIGRGPSSGEPPVRKGRSQP